MSKAINRIAVHRATAIEGVTRIDISRALPDSALHYKEEAVNEIKDIYCADAKVLEEALRNSIPGGTYDQLLSEMFARKASMFRVRFK